MLKAEHAAEERAEHHRRNAAREQDLADGHFFELPHQHAGYRKAKALSQIGEHDAEDNDVCDRDEQRGVDLVVLRHAVHLGVELKRLRKEGVFELDGWMLVHLVFRVGEIKLHALDLLQALFHLLHVLGGNPADDDEAVVVLQRLVADARIKIQLLELGEIARDALRVLAEIAVELFLRFLRLLLQKRYLLFVALDLFARGFVLAYQIGRLKIQTFKDFVDLLSLLRGREIHAPAMRLVLGTYGEVHVLVVLVRLQLLHAVLRQSAEVRLHVLHFENLLNLHIQSRKVLCGAEIVLCLPAPRGG